MRYFLPILLPFLLLSCDYFQPREKTPEALARVGDSYLPKSELALLGLENTNTDDSLKMVDAYIDNWVRREAYLQYAKDQLTEAQIAEIAKKVDDYQQSLYTHLYEEQMLANHLDSLIQTEEITAYYNEHLADFSVNTPIVKAIIIKRDTPIGNKQNKLVEAINQYLEEGNDSELKEYCTYNAISCTLDAEQWMTQASFYETLNSQASTIDINWNSSKLQEIETQDYYYLCKIIESQSAGTYPVEFVKEDIKRTILKKREQEYIESLRERIINQAKSNNEIEIYDAE